MTYEEMKEVLASTVAIGKEIRESQKRTDAQIAQTEELIAQTVKERREREKKLDERLAEIAEERRESQKEWKKEQVEYQKKLDAQFAKTEALITENGVQLKKLQEMYDGVSKSMGLTAEEFFFNALMKNPRLKGMNFPVVYRNVNAHSRNLQGEFDLILLNGKNVFVIEVKNRARTKHLHQIISMKSVNFPLLVPILKDLKIHWGLASFYFEDKLIRRALDSGVSVLRRSGKFIEADYPENEHHNIS